MAKTIQVWAVLNRHGLPIAVKLTQPGEEYLRFVPGQRVVPATLTLEAE